MRLSFKDYLMEEYRDINEINIFIPLATKDESEDMELEISVEYKTIEDEQGYDHDEKSSTIDEDSIEYDIIKSFTFDGISHQSGTGLAKFYDYIFFDDEYTSKSPYLERNTENYFMKEELSDSKKEEVLNYFIRLLIEK